MRLLLAELFETGKARWREIETVEKSLWKVAQMLSIVAAEASARSRRCTPAVLPSRIGSVDRLF
jgi:hypothetical protein